MQPPSRAKVPAPRRHANRAKARSICIPSTQIEGWRRRHSTGALVTMAGDGGGGASCCLLLPQRSTTSTQYRLRVRWNRPPTWEGWSVGRHSLDLAAACCNNLTSDHLLCGVHRPTVQTCEKAQNGRSPWAGRRRSQTQKSRLVGEATKPHRSHTRAGSRFSSRHLPKCAGRLSLAC